MIDSAVQRLLTCSVFESRAITVQRSSPEPATVSSSGQMGGISRARWSKPL